MKSRIIILLIATSKVLGVPKKQTEESLNARLSNDVNLGRNVSRITFLGPATLKSRIDKFL